ncbi:MAG: T9SS type A sorting domain-containing protein [Phaeodactylibacter sp.]|nr:T9SS type A sorting domain-containing protein [Phaeodactylibacter sp.]MCB9051109.1 T9SS type A sorting domain-containing protein [Lewinellaceae bacterium]
MHKFLILVASIGVAIAFHAVRWPMTTAAGTEAVLQGCDPDTDPPLIVYPSQNINVQLNPCDGSRTAVVFFDATASDACDPSPSLSVRVDPSAGTNLQLSNPFQNTYMALATPGAYQLTLTATDASGNSREEDFFINVSQPPAPEANLACNGTVVANLGPGCQRYVSADMLLEGDMGCLRDADFRITIEDADPSNGNILDGVGVYPFSIEPIQAPNAMGFTGPFAFSNWRAHVDFQGSVALGVNTDTLFLRGSTGAASALAVLPISYGGALSFRWGTASLPAGTQFEGRILGPSGNLITSFSSADGSSGMENLFVSAGSRLILHLLSDGQGGSGALPVAWLTGWVFDYGASSTTGIPSCWGQIEARDGGPVLDCPDEADRVSRATTVQQLTGALADGGPLLNSAWHSCLIEGPLPNGGRNYDLIAFEVAETDIYTFFLNSDFDQGGAQMALFQGSFNIDNPCANIIAQADNPQTQNPLGGNNDPYLRAGLPLRPGQQYFLLTTSDIPGATGTYSYSIVSDGTGRVLGVPVSPLDISLPLYCEDIPLVQDNEQSLDWLGVPQVQSGCTDFTLSFEDALTQQGDCGPLYITRTFIAEDQQGLTGTCQQRINFRRPSFDDVILPPRTAPIECDEAFPVDQFGNPSPDFTGYPFLLTADGIVDLRDAYCNIGASYVDGPLIDVCVLSYKFVRNWTIINSCDPDNPLEYSQVIKIGDFTAPEASCPLIDLTGDGFPDPLVYSTNPFDCTATFAAPLPQVSDNCSLWEITIEAVTDEANVIYGPSGNPIDTVWETVVLGTVLPDAPNRILRNIPVGCHRFRYTIEDECGNTAILECGFCVEDKIQPTASCDDELHISIGPGGVGRLFAASFEEGSWDNCGIERMEVRREVRLNSDCSPVTPFFTPWGEYVDFFCCEVNSNLRVELRVVDAAGNEEVCWMDALVEDKTRPSCTPPPAVTTSCDALPANFEPGDTALMQSLFGAPMVNDNCGAAWYELPPANNLDECGIGTIIRRFQAVDRYGNISNTSCQQAINIQERHNYEIKFPADAGANCGYPNPDTIGLNEIGCDLLAVSVDDVVLSASGDECYKVFRTYRVINWCEYDGEDAPMVIGRDEDCDGAPGDEAVWVLRRPEHTYIDRDNDEGNANPAAGDRGAGCQPDNPEGYWRTSFSNGYWQYSQNLKVYDTIAPQILFIIPPPFCAISDDCLAEVEYLFIVSDNCTPGDLDFEIYYDEDADGVLDSMVTNIFGVYPKWKINGEYPIGTHSFEVIVRDGCGNVASASLPFEVVDCKAPSPACINGLVTSLMATPPNTDVDNDGDIDLGAHTVYAVDFVASPISDCSGPVIYSINRPGEIPSPDQNAIILTCDDLGILIVEIHAWDLADNPYALNPADLNVRGPNHDFCETFILVQDNGGNCVISQGIVAGLVQREDDQPVEAVEVELSGDDAAAVLTADDGLYAFNGLELDYDYTITPYRDGDDHNGLSTFDIVLISQHILGTRPLDSPYKIIAADVNGSGSVSTIDIIQLRQLILSIILELPSNDSWRFVPRAYSFPDPNDPWAPPFPEAININNLNGQRLSENFVAIKVGDVDLSARANSLQGVEGRNYPYSLSLDGMDKHLQPGEQYVLTLQSGLEGILGMQAALQFDPDALVVKEVKGEAIADAYFNQRQLKEGRLAMSWNTATPYPAEVVLATFHLRARRACWLSEAIQLDESRLAAEAYGLDDQKLGLSLNWEKPSSENAGLQNYPNPFNTSTTIRFELPESGLARLEVFRLDGARVKALEAFYPAGLHEVSINSAELPGPGVYLYKLEQGGQSQVRKMVFTGG